MHDVLGYRRKCETENPFEQLDVRQQRGFDTSVCTASDQHGRKQDAQAPSVMHAVRSRANV